MVRSDSRSAQGGSPARAWWTWLGLLLWLAVAGFITLSPSGGPPRGFTWCLTCADQWLLDFVLNTVLFWPLGLLLQRRGVRWLVVVCAAAVLSGAIEAMQLALPALGRDPSLRDLLANTLGAALGAAALPGLHRWRSPGARSGRLVLAALWAIGLHVAGSWAVAPSYPRDADWFGQAAPELGQFALFAGTVRDGVVNGVALPFRESAEAVLTHGDSITVRASIAPSGVARRLAPVATVFDGRQREILVLAVRQQTAALRTRMRANDLGLNAPLFAAPLRIRSSADPAPLEALVTPRVWCLRGAVVARDTCWTRRPALLLATLIPFERALAPRSWWPDACWYLLLAAPLLALLRRRSPG